MRVQLNRGIHNFFHLLGGGGGGVVGAMSLAVVENMAALQSFSLVGSGGMVPQEILGVLRCILVHSEAYREVLRRGSSS